MKGGLYVLLADFCRDGHLLVLGRFVRIKWKVVVWQQLIDRVLNSWDQ